MDKENIPFKIKYFESISRENIKTCCQDWHKADPSLLVLALVAEANANEASNMQSIFKEISIPLVGAIFPSLIFNSEFKSSGVILICLADNPAWHIEPEIPKDKEALASCLESFSLTIEKQVSETEESTLFIIFDAMVPNIASVLDELYLNLGDSVHYAGVNAGSETFQPMACIFDNEKLIENGMLTILLKNNKGGVLEHGYTEPDKTVIATSTKSNCITSIDWKPAFEVYTAHVKEQFNIKITADNFYKYGAHFPFGIIRADGEVLVRIPVMLGSDNSLYCVGEIPENSILTLLNAPEPKSLHTVTGLVSKLNNGNNNLLFYCAGRRMHLEDSASKELNELAQLTSGKTFAGALSLGEIGSSRKGGYPLFHNATLVVLPLGENK